MSVEHPNLVSWSIHATDLKHQANALFDISNVAIMTTAIAFLVRVIMFSITRTFEAAPIESVTYADDCSYTGGYQLMWVFGADWIVGGFLIFLNLLGLVYYLLPGLWCCSPNPYSITKSTGHVTSVVGTHLLLLFVMTIIMVTNIVLALTMFKVTCTTDAGAVVTHSGFVDPEADGGIMRLKFQFYNFMGLMFSGWVFYAAHQASAYMFKPELAQDSFAKND